MVPQDFSVLSPTSSSRSRSFSPNIYGSLDEKVTVRRSLRPRNLWSVIGLVCLGSLLANIVWRLKLGSFQKTSVAILHEDVAEWLNESERIERFEKPADLQVVAFVFYTSRAKLTILDCYLQQNLVPNGGMIDSVAFIPETGNESDLDWLELLAHSHPSYRMETGNVRGNPESLQGGINLAWNSVIPETLYIHISSEIVFLEPTTISSLIETRLREPSYSFISANVINQPTLSWIHHHLGVVRQYRPELEPHLRPANASAAPRYDWRASDLPTWNGPSDVHVPAGFGVPTDFVPPFDGHRWLPLRTNHTYIPPVTHEGVDVNGPGEYSWTAGALHHYSFLEHLESRQLYKYKFPFWNLQHEILSPSMFVMWGADVIGARSMPSGNVDQWLSREFGKKLGDRYPAVDGRALAVHFAHAKQLPDIQLTDLLKRYKAYADENVCV